MKKSNTNVISLFIFLGISAFFLLYSCNIRKNDKLKIKNSNNLITSILNKNKQHTPYLIYLSQTAHNFKNDSIALYILNYALDNFDESNLHYLGSVFLEDAADLAYQLIKDKKQLQKINEKFKKIADAYGSVNIWEHGRAFMLLARAAADAGHFKTACKFASNMKISDIGQTYGYIANAAARSGKIDFAIKLTRKIYPEFITARTLVIILKEMVKSDDPRKDSLLTEIIKSYKNDQSSPFLKESMCEAYSILGRDSDVLKIIDKSNSFDKSGLIYTYIRSKYNSHDFKAVLFLYNKYKEELDLSDQGKIEGDIALLYAEQDDFAQAKKFLSKCKRNLAIYRVALKFFDYGEFAKSLSLLDMINNQKKYNSYCLNFIEILLDKDKVKEANMILKEINDNYYAALGKIFISNWYDRHEKFRLAFNGYKEAIDTDIKKKKDIYDLILDGYIIMIQFSRNPWKDELFKEIERVRKL